MFIKPGISERVEIKQAEMNDWYADALQRLKAFRELHDGLPTIEDALRIVGDQPDSEK